MVTSGISLQPIEQIKEKQVERTMNLHVSGGSVRAELTCSLSFPFAFYKQEGLSSDEIFKVEMPEGANDMGGRTIDEVIRDAGKSIQCVYDPIFTDLLSIGYFPASTLTNVGRDQSGITMSY